MTFTTFALVISLYFAFQLKHWLADGRLQPVWMATDKGFLRLKGGYIHAGIHAGFSLVILLVAALFVPWEGAIQLAFGLALAEFVIHYAIDYTKMNLDMKWHLSHLAYDVDATPYLGKTLTPELFAEIICKAPDTTRRTKEFKLYARVVTTQLYYDLMMDDQFAHQLTMGAMMAVFLAFGFQLL